MANMENSRDIAIVLFCVTATALFAMFVFVTSFIWLKFPEPPQLIEILATIPFLASSAATFLCAYWAGSPRESLWSDKYYAPLVILVANCSALIYFADSSLLLPGIAAQLPMALGFLLTAFPRSTGTS